MAPFTAMRLDVVGDPDTFSIDEVLDDHTYPETFATLLEAVAHIEATESVKLEDIGQGYYRAEGVEPDDEGKMRQWVIENPDELY